MKTYYENIAFGLKMKKSCKGEIETAVRKALDMVNLTGSEGIILKDYSLIIL